MTLSTSIPSNGLRSGALLAEQEAGHEVEDLGNLGLVVAPEVLRQLLGKVRARRQAGVDGRTCPEEYRDLPHRQDDRAAPLRAAGSCSSGTG